MRTRRRVTIAAPVPGPRAGREGWLREAICLALLIATFLAPTLQAAMLEVHRITRHGSTFAGPTALQNLTSLAGHRAADTRDHVDGDAHADPTAVEPVRWIRIDDSPPAVAHPDGHGHSHAESPSHLDAPVTDREPTGEHRHGDLVHSHDDALQELATLAAGLVKTFVQAPAPSLPISCYHAAEAFATLASPLSVPRAIHLPPPRPFSV